MGTPAMVGVQNEDGSVNAIAVHYDGADCGPILCRDYASREHALALIALGNIAALESLLAPPEGVVHTWSAPHPGVVRAYGRDRGDTGEACEHFIHAPQYARRCTARRVYAYLLPYGMNWWVRDTTSSWQFIDWENDHTMGEMDTAKRTYGVLGTWGERQELERMESAW